MSSALYRTLSTHPSRGESDPLPGTVFKKRSSGLAENERDGDSPVQLTAAGRKNSAAAAEGHQHPNASADAVPTSALPGPPGVPGVGGVSQLTLGNLHHSSRGGAAGGMGTGSLGASSFPQPGAPRGHTSASIPSPPGTTAAATNAMSTTSGRTSTTQGTSGGNKESVVCEPVVPALDGDDEEVPLPRTLSTTSTDNVMNELRDRRRMRSKEPLLFLPGVMTQLNPGAYASEGISAATSSSTSGDTHSGRGSLQLTTFPLTSCEVHIAPEKRRCFSTFHPQEVYTIGRDMLNEHPPGRLRSAWLKRLTKAWVMVGTGGAMSGGRGLARAAAVEKDRSDPKQTHDEKEQNVQGTDTAWSNLAFNAVTYPVLCVLVFFYTLVAYLPVGMGKKFVTALTPYTLPPMMGSLDARMQKIRAELLKNAHGTVLDFGAGSGVYMKYCFPRCGGHGNNNHANPFGTEKRVRRYVALEPNVGVAAGIRVERDRLVSICESEGFTCFSEETTPGEGAEGSDGDALPRQLSRTSEQGFDRENKRSPRSPKALRRLPSASSGDDPRSPSSSTPAALAKSNTLLSRATSSTWSGQEALGSEESFAAFPELTTDADGRPMALQFREEEGNEDRRNGTPDDEDRDAASLSESAIIRARGFGTRYYPQVDILTSFLDEAIASGKILPGSVDYIILGNALCMVPDPEKVISDLRKVLRPSTGRLYFSEHVGFLPKNSWRRWRQERLNSWWERVSDGCCCNRDSLVMLCDEFDVVSWEIDDCGVMPWNALFEVGLAAVPAEAGRG